jgi:hypothetical protein
MKENGSYAGIIFFFSYLALLLAEANSWLIVPPIIFTIFHAIFGFIILLLAIGIIVPFTAMAVSWLVTKYEKRK